MKVTVERRKTVQVIWLTRDSRRFCQECLSESLFLSPEDAVTMTGTDRRLIDSLLASGHLHCCGSDQRASLICLESLKTEIEREVTTEVSTFNGGNPI